jgi:hypothetical protein
VQTQLKTCFNGCSFTEGWGFPVEQRDTYIYDRLLAKKYSFESTNIAMGGSSNHLIFMKSCQAIMSGQYDIVFTQWTALNRLWLYPGPDCQFFVNELINPDFSYREIHLSKKERTQLRTQLLILNHDFHNILALIDYCVILSRLAEHSKTKIIFINGLVPWTSDLDRPVGTDLSLSLSEYSKEILDFDHRDDSEITKFFTILQEKFLLIDKSKWVNIFDSLFLNQTDLGPEGHHPGIHSHQWMAQQVSTYLENHHIL